MRELDIVYTLDPCISNSGIEIPENSVGTLVHVYPNGLDFEVEFPELDTSNLVLATRNSSQVKRCSEWPIHIIHTKQSFILSKKPYQNWRQIQNEYAEYVASLGPMNLAELKEYLTIEYKNSWPIRGDKISAFVYSSAIELKCS